MSVAGSGAFASTSALNSWPPCSPSMSKTANPEPVASAILASGHLVHQRLIVASSSVASLNPPLVRGCFAALEQSVLPQLQRPSTIEWQGKILHRIRE